MKQLKAGAFAALAMALMSIAGASTASATTLEAAGVAKNESVTVTVSLKSGTSASKKITSGSTLDTCGSEDWGWPTAKPYTGTTVTGAIQTMTSGCLPVSVHKPGKIYIEHIAGTTNGTVYSEETEMTEFSNEFGIWLPCKTGTGTHIGTLTGVKEGHATLHVNAVINCGFFAPTVKWEGTYTVTSPTGLGVSA
jgi:hypothetical protein